VVAPFGGRTANGKDLEKEEHSHSFESITEVTETRPDLWSAQQWQKHLAAEAAADTPGA